jgi:aromatase
MGHTCNSIVIDATYDKVFDISNDIPRWTELFGGEYKVAEITKREGNKITFRLTDDEGKSWQSWRLLFKDKFFAYAEREEPKFPFKYMKIIWLYTPKSEGMALAAGSQTTSFCPVEMTWIQHFEMDPKAKFNDEQVEGFINKHSKDNLKIFKEVIEGEAEKK